MFSVVLSSSGMIGLAKTLKSPDAIRMPAKLWIWLRARQTTISANDWIESKRRVRPSRSFSMPQAVALNIPMRDEIITTMPICVPVRPMSLR